MARPFVDNRRLSFFDPRLGRRNDSFFGQFESNSNLYLGLRRGF